MLTSPVRDQNIHAKPNGTELEEPGRACEFLNKITRSSKPPLNFLKMPLPCFNQARKQMISRNYYFVCDGSRPPNSSAGDERLCGVLTPNSSAGDERLCGVLSGEGFLRGTAE